VIEPKFSWWYLEGAHTFRIRVAKRTCLSSFGSVVAFETSWLIGKITI
jgi:hypothetical protein